MNSLRPDSPFAQHQTDARSTHASTPHNSVVSRRSRISDFILRHDKAFRIILISIIVLSIIAIALLIVRLITNNLQGDIQVEQPSQESIDLSQEVNLYSMGYYSGDPQELYTQLEQIINSNSANPTTKTAASTTLAELYLVDMEYQKAIDLLKSSLDLYTDPNNQVEILYHLNSIYGELGLVDEQIRCLERMVSYPENGIQLADENWSLVREGAILALEQLKSGDVVVDDGTNLIEGESEEDDEN